MKNNHFILILVIFSYKKTVQPVPSLSKVNDTINIASYDGSIKNDSLISTIHDIIRFFNNKDENKLNKLIHPETGLFFLFRRGTIDEWKNLKQIGLSKKSPIQMEIPWWYKEQIIKQKIVENFKIEHVENPIFIECDSISKIGLFNVENSNSKSILTSTIENYIHALSDDVLSIQDVSNLQLKIDKFKKLESNSKRVVLVKNNSESLIFHLAYINNKWYLYILDFITNDCSV